MLQVSHNWKRCVFYAPQSETKDGGAFASRRKDAPPSDKGHKIHIFSMHRTNGIAPVNSNNPLISFFARDISYNGMEIFQNRSKLCVNTSCPLALRTKPVEDSKRTSTGEVFNYNRHVYVRFLRLRISERRENCAKQKPLRYLVCPDNRLMDFSEQHIGYIFVCQLIYSAAYSPGSSFFRPLSKAFRM